MPTWYVFEKINGEWQVNARHIYERSARDGAAAQTRESLYLSDDQIGRSATLLRLIQDQIGAFEKECAKKEHTDTDEAWHLFNRIYAEISKIYTPPKKRRKAKRPA